MEEKSTLAMLFDMSFTEFVTTRVIRFLFIIGIFLGGVGTLSAIARAFHSGFFRGLIVLILSPLLFLLYVLISRIWCEIVMVVFRIAENTSRLVEQGKKSA